ncbi:5'/3'-nucleotidase SurE [Mailhella sp.]|uniref:5'/3'-nucleotidase SurE n=1 Tax=Mailhella sp. TaxID=1981029 RepID=UPI004063900D
MILALHGLFPDFEPELVISGINFGPNAGLDIFFSGTVGAAVQGAMNGIPSLAASHAGYGNTDMGHARLVARLVDEIDWTSVPAKRVYNFNIPDCPAERVKGLKLCPQSTDWVFLEGYVRRTAPNGTTYFWIKDPFEHFRVEDEGFDKSWIHQGWATLTPLRLDLTDYELMDTLRASLGRNERQA